TILTVVATPLLYVLIQRLRHTMQHGPTTPFRFMDLPPELRLRAFDYLLEDPAYPPPPPSSNQHASALTWMLPTNWGSASSRTDQPGPHKSNWILLANKQLYAEYMDYLCKKATFHLTVSPANYPPSIPTPTSSPTSSPSPFPSPVPAPPQRLWALSPTTLTHLRHITIKLITTSSMLGVPDPRAMRISSWPLARQIRAELHNVPNVQEVNLHVKAIGDPLWNPLWVWYHASQSFKSMGGSPPASPTTDDADPLGPRLNRITFSLDTWSPGENYLERDAANRGQWAWWCAKGHCVGGDGGSEMTVREFCARLYMECRICRPELESEDEE
ncbi:hypothetical protein BDV95DRAFT_464570, partial [Massariosphaeria phaeospora]